MHAIQIIVTIILPCPMTSIDTTVYPHLNKKLSEEELAHCYEINDDEKVFIQRHA